MISVQEYMNNLRLQEASKLTMMDVIRRYAYHNLGDTIMITEDNMKKALADIDYIFYSKEF